MRKATAHLFSSVDGVVERPDTFFRFESMGPEEAAFMAKGLATCTDVILGRKIYQEWAGYWPTQKDDPFAAFINPAPKYVASRTLTGDLERENATLIDGDLIEFVRTLKEGEGGDINVDGITVIRELILARLLDTLTLTVHPAAAGSGRTLFESIDGPLLLDLVDSTVTKTGNAILTYRFKD
ncbi:MAG: dihydrofolate reductase family protein [Tetrasphaera sp.]